LVAIGRAGESMRPLQCKDCSPRPRHVERRFDPATGLGTYADVTVICGKVEFDPEDRKGHTALGPKVVVEVLSPSTEPYDRGEKLAHCKQIPALQGVLFVAHDRREVEIVRREADGSWSRHVAGAGASARLDSLECDLPVNEMYRDPLAT